MFHIHQKGVKIKKWKKREKRRKKVKREKEIKWKEERKKKEKEKNKEMEKKKKKKNKKGENPCSYPTFEKSLFKFQFQHSATDLKPWNSQNKILANCELENS